MTFSPAAKPQFFVAAAYAAILIVFALFIWTYAFNFPYREDYILADWHRASLAGKMSLIEIINQRNVVHPLGAMAAFTIALFAAFGVNFNLIVACNAVLLVAAQYLIFLSVRPLKTPFLTGVAALTILIIGLHASQTNHLLWPFELCWFIITLCLAVNVFLVERLSTRWLWLVALPAMIASFSSAHGIFLWPAALFHIVLKYNWRNVWPTLALLAIGAAFWFVAISKLAPPDEVQHPIVAIPEIVRFFVGLIGGTAFGVKHEQFAVYLGIATGGLTALIFLLLYFKQPKSPAARVGATLAVASLLMLAAFSLGRFSYGLIWAFGSFHAGTQSMPLLLGIGIISLALLEHFKIRYLSALSLLFVLLATFSATTYGLQRGFDSRNERATAMHYTCAGSSPYLYAELNGFNLQQPHNIELIRRTEPFWRDLCGQPLPKMASLLVDQPILFKEISAANPDAAKPLDDLWQVYIANYFLLHAFSLAEPDGPKRILQFFRSNAVNGTIHFGFMMKQHETFLKEFAMPLSGQGT